MKQSQKKYKRIVIKIGSSLLCENRKPNLGFFEEVVGQVASLIKQDYEVVIVSSGAIASGMSMLGLNVRPLGAAGQAAAAIGQPRLMDLYKEYFKEHKINCAQVLLTWDDFDDRKRYLNAKNTLLKLLEFKAIPIVNENDTVATDEIGFGDNDRLSALVARLVGADVLIILSDVDGLLNKDRNLIPFVENITLEIKALACPTNNKTCVGGMVTKIEAAKIATDAGIACVISNGRKKDIIASVLTEPEKNGTLFYPKSGMSARKHWIAFSVKPKGRIIVDDGAKEALLKNKKSLLSVGITGLEGSFESGDVVALADKEGNVFAKGKVEVSSKDLEGFKGKRHSREIVHRDNIAVLA